MSTHDFPTGIRGALGRARPLAGWEWWPRAIVALLWLHVAAIAIAMIVPGGPRASAWPWVVGHGVMATLLSILLVSYGRAAELERTGVVSAYRRRLEDSQNRYRHLVETLPGVVYSAPFGDGKWSYVGPQIEPLLGLTQEEATARPFWSEMLHPHDRDDVMAAEAGCKAVGDVFDCVYRLVARDGRIVWVRDQASVIAGSGGELLMQGVLYDITRQIETEEQLRQSQKMEAIGQLAGGIAHDFNNLLGVIQNYAAFVLEDLDDRHPSREDVEEIVKATRSGTALTRKVLAFSHRETASPEVLDLNERIVETERFLGRLIRANISLELDLDRAVQPVFIDPLHVEQILMNLAVNARDAMPGGGVLHVSTGTEVLNSPQGDLAAGPHVALTVSDTGAGIDDAIVDRVFEPFFTTKPRGKGTGLGLATVYGLVQQAGGDISVHSTPGLGARFKILLPVHTGGRVEPAVTRSLPPVRSSPGVVLVVEDQAAMRRLSVRILRDHGWEVLEASSAAEALDVVSHSTRVDVVLTDVVMPGGSGVDLAAEVQKRHPGVKVVLMSGYADDVISPGDFGTAERLIKKPFDAETLAAVIGEVAASSSPPKLSPAPASSSRR